MEQGQENVGAVYGSGMGMSKKGASINWGQGLQKNTFPFFSYFLDIRNVKNIHKTVRLLKTLKSIQF